MSATLEQYPAPTSAKRTRVSVEGNSKNAGEDVTRDDQVGVAEPGGATVGRGIGIQRAFLERDIARSRKLLHRQSDDFEATARLGAAEKALASLPQPDGPWAWQERLPTGKRPARSLRRLNVFFRR